MTTQFPSSIISFSTKANGGVIDASHINDLQNEVVALEAKVGVDSSASVLSLDYKVSNALSNGGGHVQTANKGGTGQTSYTKGDILVATSSSVLGKQAVGGTDGYALVVDSTQTNGVKWGLPGNAPVVRTYTSSVITVWTRPSILSYVVVEVQGNGGAGGQAGNGNGTSGGSGGGGGGYARKTIVASSILASQNVLVRGGGVGSVLSYFGSVLGATGGTDGGANGATPGVGGIGSGGDLNIKGSGGGIGLYKSATSAAQGGGHGGSGVLGGGAATTAPSVTNGLDGGQYGGGGSGGSDSNATGGAGAGGIVIVYEY